MKRKYFIPLKSIRQKKRSRNRILARLQERFFRHTLERGTYLEESIFRHALEIAFFPDMWYR